MNNKTMNTTRNLVTIYSVVLVTLMGVILAAVLWGELARSLKSHLAQKQEMRLRVARQMLSQEGGEFALLEGRLYAGTAVLDGNSELVDRIASLCGGEVTIVRGYQRVATTLRLPDGTRAVQTHIPREAFEHMSAERAAWSGETRLLTDTYWSVYEPLFDPYAQWVGAIAIEAPKSDYEQTVRQVVVRGAVVTGIGVLVIGLLVFAALDRLTRRLREVATSRQLLLDSTAEGIFGTDADGRCSFVNRSALELTGRCESEILGKHASAEMLDASVVEKKLGKLPLTPGDVQGGQSRSETLLRKKGGDPFPAEFSASTYLDVQGKPGMVVVFGDISERKKAEAEIARKNKEIADALEAVKVAGRSKASFIACMSRELRTQLHGVLGLLGLFKEEGLNAEQTETLRTAGTAGNQVLRLVGHVLDFSLVELGQMQVQRETFTVADIVSRACAAATRGDSRERPVAVVWEMAPESRVTGDPEITAHLLSTALSHALASGTPASIILRVSLAPAGEQSSKLNFSMDNPNPFPTRAELETLAQGYTKGDPQAMQRFGGAGLALAACQQLAGLCGGGLTASPTGAGSPSLELSVGVGQPMSEVVPAKDESGRGAQPSGDRAALRILVAEDIKLNYRILSGMLSRLGCSCDWARDGAEAVSRVMEKTYDLVFMDVEMPEMTGIEATRQIREKVPAARQPMIVAMTADAMPGDRARCLSAGMDNYLSKPVSEGEVESVLKSTPTVR